MFPNYLTGDAPATGGPCPESHYCPEGTSYPLACPSGTYNNRTGRWECDECPAGYFCPENITSYEPYYCPVGHYCPNGTKNNNEYPCPMGTFRNETGGISVADCFPCPCGEYCGTIGLENPSGECSAGKEYRSHVMRNPAFCACENKDVDQLRGYHPANQRLCFHYIDSTIGLLSKFEILIL